MGTLTNPTVLRQCFSWLNIHFEDEILDHRCRKLHTGQAIFLFLEAALQQRQSLSSISENLASKTQIQKWLKLESIHSSSLYRKLERLPLELLQEIFHTIVRAIAEHYAGKTGIARLGKLQAIDSTEIRLPTVYGKWAYVSKSKNAVKMHTSLLVGDESSVCPERVVLSTADVSDQDAEVMMELVTESANTKAQPKRSRRMILEKRQRSPL